MRILLMGLSADDRDAVRRSLQSLTERLEYRDAHVTDEYLEALRGGEPDLIIAGGRDKAFDAFEALRAAGELRPEAAFIGLARKGKDAEARGLVEAGAVDAFPLDQLWRLPLGVTRVLEWDFQARSSRRLRGMEVLLDAVKQLSLARRMDQIVEVVRHAARNLGEADGATFVLKDGNQCHYVDEDAIGPLWRGRRFPMSNCVSGWAMNHRQAAVIPDIYADPRVPIDAYRPTFVKSMVMMPIRSGDPIGAIGTYWARRRTVSEEEVALIQVLADSTALAVENVQIYADLERRVKERTASLEGANKELEAFAYSVSHDLRSPLTVILGYSDLLTNAERVDIAAKDREMLQDMRAAAGRMSALIDDLLRLSQVTCREVEVQRVDLSDLAREILASLAAREPGRRVETAVAEGLVAHGDPGLLRVAMENLLSNAWKYSSKKDVARIEVGAEGIPGGGKAFYVKDDGAGFDLQNARKLFEPFQRMHTSREFPGTGIGLATVNRVMQKHGGRVWAEAEKGRGAIFRFSLPDAIAVVPGLARIGEAVSA